MRTISTTDLLFALGVFNSLITISYSLGINCQGSFLCSPITSVIGAGATGVELGYLRIAMQDLDDDTFFNDGTQLACTVTANDLTLINSAGDFTGTRFCAFMQGTDGAPGSSLKQLALDLEEHGCNTCGSVPILFPGSNDPSQGILTINAVSTGCFDGSDPTTPPDGIGLCPNPSIQ